MCVITLIFFGNCELKHTDLSGIEKGITLRRNCDAIGCTSVLLPVPNFGRKMEGDPFLSRRISIFGVPRGIRTPVTAVKGRCPRPG